MAASDKTSPRKDLSALPPVLRGYIEGYYGRLLDWEDRVRILHVGGSAACDFRQELLAQLCRQLLHFAALVHLYTLCLKG